MRRPMIVGNWKMYTLAADANILAVTIRNNIVGLEGIEVVVCPPSIWLSEVSNIVGKGGKVNIGAQNMFSEPEGAYTGEISPLMVRELAKYVIVGHSERREYFGETNFDVNDKVIAAIKAGLSPIICVGETKKSAKYPSTPVRQLKEALAHVPKKYYKQIVVAYEPVWAIGTDKNADAEYCAKVINALREIVLRDAPILYGGSTDSKNAKEYGMRPEIDGLLVGGSSLRASEFVKICSVWSQCKSFKKDLVLEEK